MVTRPDTIVTHPETFGRRPLHRAHLAFYIALIWLSGVGCVDESGYCQGPDECASGRCILGRCADPAAVDATLPDGAGPEVDSAAPVDARPPDVARSPDMSVDADALAACDAAGPVFERCGLGSIRRVDCVDGRIQRGPCAWVPEDPCGEVCRGEGCRSGGVEGVSRRVAYGAPSSIPGLTLFVPWVTGSMRCSGCNWFYSGNLDLACETAFDLDGLPARTDCLYCHGDARGTTTYTFDDGALTLETRCEPSQRPDETRRVVLRADGQVDRVEVTAGEQRYTMHGRYGAGGLLEQIETIDDTGAVRERRTLVRGEGGRITEARGAGPYGEFTVSYDYGCRACVGDDCPADALADCTPVAGAVPQAYMCLASGPDLCPVGTLPGWLEDSAEAVWLATHMLDDDEPPSSRWVGARFDGETWRWQATGEPVSLSFSGGFQAEQGELGYCARLSIVNRDLRNPLGGSGYVDRWRAELEARRCAALEEGRGWCRADRAAEKNRPVVD